MWRGTHERIPFMYRGRYRNRTLNIRIYLNSVYNRTKIYSDFIDTNLSFYFVH